MLREILFSIQQRIRQGFLTEKLYRKRKQRTAVIPRKGMLVYHWDYYSFYTKEDLTHRENYCLVLDAIVDDYGNCKFQYLSEEKIKWTDWITVQKFNEEWEIFNPWV